MFKRSLVVGGLIAGAFLLPNVASAGVVNGQCVNCHTMHNSQNGGLPSGATSATPNAKLLLGNGCAGCHATADNNTDANGKPVTGKKAPQVDYNAASKVNAAGYFSTTAGTDAHQHNAELVSPGLDPNFSGKSIPGSATAYTAQVKCDGCHTQAGHHTSTANTYRMLTGTNTTAGIAGSYSPSAAAGSFPGARHEISYVAADMNTFCAGCHPNFHGLGANNTGAAGGGAWIRHPTNVSLTSLAGTRSIVAPSFTTNDVIVVGDKAVSKDVMCLSCHVAHGGPNNDLLSFDYTTVQAGGATPVNDGGCETCHDYGTGM
jgi:predicted CXXCH cytochrome family protein